MSNRFVRSSKFRHVHGKAENKADNQFTDCKAEYHGDGNHIAGNGKYFCYASVGGGGPVMIQELAKPGRFNPMSSGIKLQVHTSKVLEFAFNPFNDQMLATGSDDATVKISIIPGDAKGGSSISAPAANLRGHQKKIGFLNWNPVASNIIASGSADKTVKIWDVEAQEAVFDVKLADAAHSFAWSENGSQLAITAKDKKIHVVDPRDTSGIQSIAGFQGAKSAKVHYMPALNQICCVGFTRSSQRVIRTYDLRNLGSPVNSVNVDQAAGVFMTHFDPDTSMLYLAGKGDSSIKYYEITSTGLFPLSSFSDNTGTKGVCFLPKLTVDVSKCEVAKALRMTKATSNSTITPVHFMVPRKSELFQDDIFPETYAGEPSLSAAQWIEGKNADAKKTSMDPSKRTGERVAQTFVAKKSAAELQVELDAALAKIAQLEAQLAAR